MSKQIQKFNKNIATVPVAADKANIAVVTKAIEDVLTSTPGVIDSKGNATYNNDTSKTVSGDGTSNTNLFGTGTKISTSNGTAMGQYNATAEALLVVGNGTSDSNRKDLLLAQNNKLTINIPTNINGEVNIGNSSTTLKLKVNGQEVKTGDATISAAGSNTNPIYINSSGVPTASTGTVGSSSQPIYLNNGTLTASSSSIGNEDTLLYLQNGILKEGKKVYFEENTVQESEITITPSLFKETNIALDDNYYKDPEAETKEIGEPYVYAEAGILIPKDAQSCVFFISGNRFGTILPYSFKVSNLTKANDWYPLAYLGSPYYSIDIVTGRDRVNGSSKLSLTSKYKGLLSRKIEYNETDKQYYLKFRLGEPCENKYIGKISIKLMWL